MKERGTCHRTLLNRILLILLVGLYVVFLLQPSRAQAAAADASSTSSNEIVIQHSQSVHDLLMVGKSLDIKGDISDNLITIDCNIHLEAGGHVDTLLAIGGHVQQDAGSSVRNGLLLTPSGDTLNHLVMGIALMSMTTLVKFVACAFLLFSSVAFHVLLRTWLNRQVQQLERSISKFFVIGLVVFIGLAAAVIGLALTGIGLPIATLIMLMYAFLGLIGLAGISLLIGRTILHPYRESVSDWVSASVGTLILIGCFNIPVVGILFFLVAWCTGTSTILTSFRRVK